ncbi:hypothetical protein [Kibdelosporangium aridum]|uniref:hypothetical protein n=1 Tax=Kibdelosporangium aridum TaxID=2030 RepID=UPI0005252A29
MDIDFFAGIVRTGTVLGTDAGLDQAVLARILGEPAERETSGDDPVWTYDFARFTWIGRPDGLLPQGDRFHVPVRSPLPFADLRAATGMPFVACPNLNSHWGRQALYWQPESEMVVSVEGEMVREISSGFKRHLDVLDRYRLRKPDVWEVLTPDKRETWFAANEPDCHERHEWWLYHCIIIGAKAEMIHDPDERAEWVDYVRWAWHAAVEIGPISPAVATIHLAEALADVETGGLAPVLSPSDPIVAQCLSHVSGSMSRTDKNLIDMAGLHRHGIEDPEVQALFDTWFAVRTDVPSATLPEM